MTSYGQNYNTPRADFSLPHGKRPTRMECPSQPHSPHGAAAEHWLGPAGCRHDDDDDDDGRKRRPNLPLPGTKVFDHPGTIAHPANPMCPMRSDCSVIGSKSELFPGLFLMGRSDYHTVLSIYYYIVTGYEPIGFGPLPDQEPFAKILRWGGGRRKPDVLWSKL